jgi:2-hydroxy-3-oxopropionate reductase
MPKDKVGFIGLGVMGKPMARSLIESGIDTMIRNFRRPEPVRELERLGAKPAASVKEIGALCDIIIVMVGDTGQAEEVILGEEGLMVSMKKGSVVVIMSTVDPRFCGKVEKVAKERGVGVLDAPVSGFPKGAETRSLTIMVGGEKDLLDRCRYIFETMGNRIFHVGGFGAAQVVKVAQTNIFFAIAVATAGGIALAAKAGIGAERFLEIIQTTAANSWIAHNWEQWSRKGRENKASLEDSYRKLKLAVDLAKGSGISLPLSEAILLLDIGKIIDETERLSKEV